MSLVLRLLGALVALAALGACEEGAATADGKEMLAGGWAGANRELVGHHRGIGRPIEYPYRALINTLLMVLKHFL